MRHRSIPDAEITSGKFHRGGSLFLLIQSPLPRGRASRRHVEAERLCGLRLTMRSHIQSATPPSSVARPFFREHPNPYPIHVLIRPETGVAPPPYPLFGLGREQHLMVPIRWCSPGPMAAQPLPWDNHAVATCASVAQAPQLSHQSNRRPQTSVSRLTAPALPVLGLRHWSTWACD